MTADQLLLNKKLQIAASSGYTSECVSLIEGGADIEAKDAEQKTPLALAAMNGHDRTCVALLDRNANIEARDSAQRTPMILAAWNRKPAACTALLDRGADIEAKDSDQRTALARIALNGLTEMCLVLLDRGADIESKDFFERSPLALAASKGRTQTCLALIDRGANVESLDRVGRTPLVRADDGHLDTCRVLLACGARPSLEPNSRGSVDRFPQSRLQYAALYGEVRWVIKALDADEGADLVGRAKEAAILAQNAGKSEVFQVLSAWVAANQARSVLDAMVVARCSP